MKAVRLQIIAVWLGATLVFGGLALFATPIVTQISQIIPRTDATADLIDDLYSSIAARMVLIAIEGDSEQARSTTSMRLAERMRTSPLFVRVLNGPASLSEDDLRELFSYRYLLSPTVSADRFTTDGLRQALTQRLADLASPFSPINKEYLPGDPTGEFRSLLRLMRGETREPAICAGVWCSPDRTRAILLVETESSGFDPLAQRAVVSEIERRFAEIKGIADVSLLLSGPGVLAIQSEEAIRTEATVLSLTSLALIITLLVLAYRSVRVILLCPLPLLSAVAVGVAVVGLIYGGVQGIVLGFGATLMGIAVDYPVHLFSQLRSDQSVSGAIRRIWPTLRLCAATTAIGYLAMITTHLTGLAQLGIFSLLGLVTAAIVTRWVLPALLPATWAPPVPIGQSRMLARLLGLRLPARPIIAVTALLFTVLVAALAIHPPAWQSDLAALSPIPAPVLAEDARMRSELGAPETGHILFIRAITPEAALHRSEELTARLQRLVDAGELAGFDAPSLYLPSQATQRLRRSALPDEASLQASLDAARAGLPFKAGLFSPFMEAVKATRNGRLIGVEDLRHTPLGLRLDSLLYPSEGGWTGIVLLSGVRDPQHLAAVIGSLGYSDVHYLDFRAATTRLMTEFRDEALDRLTWGAALLVGVLLWGVRSWKRALVVLLPMGLAIVLDLAVLTASGEPLTLFHLVSLLLVVGLGIDYGLFFSEADADPVQQRRTLHALLVCSSSTAIGFGVLCFSSIPVLTAIGQTVALGVVAAFLFAALIARPWAISRLSKGESSL